MKLLKKNLNFLTLIELGYKVVKEAAIDAAFVANAANISYDMAHKYIDVLAKNQVIGGPDEDGKYSVFLTEAGFEHKISASELRIGSQDDGKELDFTALFPLAEDLVRGEDEDFDEDFEEEDEEDFDDFDEDLDDDDDDLFGSFTPIPDCESLEDEVKHTANILIEAFSSFGITVSITDVDIGPRLMRFVLVPARGVKVSSIINLQDDIALYLAASSLRMEAPIPDRNAIGIEIPRRNPETVRLTELFECDEVKNATAPTSACIGKDIEGKPVLLDLAKIPRILVSGSTGMGKSCLLDCIISSIVKKASPDEVKLMLIDPKMVEFTRYKGLPHLLCDPIHGIPETVGALKWANDEMERRYSLYQEAMVVKLKDYNAKAPKGETLPEIIIIIDELADLMIAARQETETYLARLAQKSRAAGIYLIISTQRPDVSIVTGTLKANIPARICLRTASYIDSRVVLDVGGAERLLGRGDMLISLPGEVKPQRVQGAYISEAEMAQIIEPKKAEKASINEGLLHSMEMGKKLVSKRSGENKNEPEEEYSFLEDPQFLEAVDVALTQGQVSTALLQRRLSIGFGKAARYIDAMEAMGIVSEKCGAKPRVVLLTREEWAMKLSRAEL